eukprot:366391-Chlamydomonas_euryale.AAC.2
MSTILYLETFVDSTQGLPPDLQRQLTNIKALDEKCESLSAQVQEAVVQLQAMPPQHSTGSSPSEEYVNLSCRVEADQRLLLQFAEEKVMIAQQVGDVCGRCGRFSLFGPCMVQTDHQRAWRGAEHGRYSALRPVDRLDTLSHMEWG